MTKVIMRSVGQYSHFGLVNQKTPTTSAIKMVHKISIDFCEVWTYFSAAEQMGEWDCGK
jgi:hypothetical protein